MGQLSAGEGGQGTIVKVQILISLRLPQKQEGSPRRAKNLSGDIKDSEIYTDLIHQIAPKVHNQKILNERDKTELDYRTPG